MSILAVLVYLQAISMYALEARNVCQKSSIKSEIKNHCASPKIKAHCCDQKPSKKNHSSEKSCCGDMCKCQHLNHLQLLMTLPIHSSEWSINALAFHENDKINYTFLHGVDPISNILQPPRI